MIYIYYTYLSEENHEKLLKNHLTAFPEQYQEKIKKYKRWQDAQLSLLGRLLLFKGVEEIEGVNLYDQEIKYTKHNKPYFENSLIRFNISHSGEIAVCALSYECEIGIDIEIMEDIEIDDFKFQMTKKERDKIFASINKKESFFDYWTQKEAVIKAHGHGLLVPLKSFEILEDTARIDNENFFIKEIGIDQNYKCYISSNKKINDILLKKI